MVCIPFRKYSTLSNPSEPHIITTAQPTPSIYALFSLLNSFSNICLFVVFREYETLCGCEDTLHCICKWVTKFQGS